MTVTMEVRSYHGAYHTQASGPSRERRQSGVSERQSDGRRTPPESALW